MSEPKYEVGDWVELHTGVIVRIERLQACRDGQAYWCNDIESFHAEEEIKHAVKIIPIANKPYCKDCKHLLIDTDNTAYFANCPLAEWVEYINGTRAFIPISDMLDTLQPPDNYYCFVPKESK